MTPGDHYSYTHYADAKVAAGFDELRFGGPIGRYLAAAQEQLLLSALIPLAGQHVIDVGTGTGRAAIALARAGAIVTGVDASNEMLDVARRRAGTLSADFLTGDAHDLPFPDRSFDSGVSFRLLMHAPDWGRCLAELCRVTRWRVIVDFPALSSAAALESALRRAAHGLGRRTEPYRVLAERTVVRALASHGFRLVSVHRQFVLPIALHKAIGSLAFTQASERMMASAGLLRLLGSPVTMVAER